MIKIPFIIAALFVAFAASGCSVNLAEGGVASLVAVNKNYDVDCSPGGSSDVVPSPASMEAMPTATSEAGGGNNCSILAPSSTSAAAELAAELGAL